MNQQISHTSNRLVLFSCNIALGGVDGHALLILKLNLHSEQL